MNYKGSCHCGSVSFEFSAPEITSGLRCNCSICRRKGALMSDFVLAPDELTIHADTNALSTYSFGSDIASHQFCKRCGIYTFHQTLRKPGHYRVNLGCIDDLDCFELTSTVFDGASL